MKRLLSPARVLVVVYPRIGPRTRLAEAATEMSTDLPAAALGEIVAEALRIAWKDGYDPVKLRLEVTFS